MIVKGLWATVTNGRIVTSSLGRSLDDFSAVCWLYGKYLHETLGYPIGLVESCHGSTSVETWSSPDALQMCGWEYSL